MQHTNTHTARKDTNNSGYQPRPTACHEGEERWEGNWPEFIVKCWAVRRYDWNTNPICFYPPCGKCWISLLRGLGDEVSGSCFCSADFSTCNLIASGNKPIITRSLKYVILIKGGSYVEGTFLSLKPVSGQLHQVPGENPSPGPVPSSSSASTAQPAWAPFHLEPTSHWISPPRASHVTSSRYASRGEKLVH